ncbi:SRPBCC family protein [Ideonella sp. DXS29W]|uniref:SRPBCC family protein n=1 Tax=Ideonella lacteola TaxID=2984193 RepID=A0ABU9BU14_9BURK
MSRRVVSRHRIAVNAPIADAFMFFTPAGEERWVQGWQPTYLSPPDGRTEAGMVFTTGEGAERTIWLMVDFDRTQHRSRYVRCTPASRTGTVEVRCSALSTERTEVEVVYDMTALDADGSASLDAYEGRAFVEMIDGWARDIELHIDVLRAGPIR